MAVLPCSGCKPHEYQDKKYGPRNRVMNALAGSPGHHRCTVCGTSTGGGPAKKK